MTDKKTDRYAVILAGGAGTRFWPMSRKKNPKQFLKIIGGKSLLVQTVERIRPLVDPANIFIVTNRLYKPQIREQLKAYRVPVKNVLLEPQARNTAPAIGWAAAKILEMNPNGVMMVLPSDHLILNVKAYNRALSEALALAAHDVLVTFGIKPTRPETGYGYVKTRPAALGGRKVLKVDQFKEKPAPAVARKYVKAGAYYWNSGMFIWKASAIMDAFGKHLPEIARNLKGNTGSQKIRRVWGRLTKTSIDYGILEKADNVYCVPAHNIGWTDLGSWESLAEILPKDNKGNAVDPGSLALDCRNTTVKTQSRTVVAIGVENIIIAESPDAVLICRAEDSQKVKAVTDIFGSKKEWAHLT